MNAAPSIEVSQLCKSYGSFQVLDHLSLRVEAGSVHGLVGLNGSGKTTTLSCLLGLQAVDAGSVSILGLAPKHLYRTEGRVVAIFDSPSLHPQLTVRQTLEHARLLCPRPSRSAAEVEAMLGLERFSRFRIRNLSLGNRRRASIAHAFLGDPELVLLDEPFNGLDAGGVDEVLALIGTMNREFGTTFLLSSHQLPYLEQVCSHLAILHRGKIVASEPVSELLESLEHGVAVQATDILQLREVAAQLGCTVLAEADNELQLAPGGLNNWQLNQALLEAGVQVTELRSQRRSLDSVFRQYTGQSAP
jgi:ABC-2 type transport system ATP-binding protein